MSEIPERCVNCPAVKRQQETIQGHEEQISEYIERLMSDDLVKQAAAVLENYPQMAEVYGASSAEELAVIMRQQGSLQLEIFEQHNETHRATLAKIVHGCLGAMELTGSNEDTEVTVTACMSPVVERGTGPHYESVTIDRQAKA